MPKLRRALAGATVLCSLAGVASATAASPTRVRVGSTPRRPARSTVIGALPSGTPISIFVTLKPRDPAGLASYAAAVSTPGSPLYQRYLTVSQFRQRFGATQAQVRAVDQSLIAHGLRPGAVTANGLSIPVSSSAGAVGQALSVSLERVSLPSGRIAFTNTQPPQFDASVADAIQGVVGLNAMAAPHPHGIRVSHGQVGRAPHVVTGGPQPCSGASGTGAHTADQIASAYGFSALYAAGDEGVGQKVALLELEPYSDTDIASYQQCYGTNASVSKVTVDGGAGTGTGSGEAALDIEDVIGLAPQAKVLVYEGPDTSSGVFDTYNKIISDDAAQVIATSWGMCEPLMDSGEVSSENTLFQEAAVQGQSIFAAAGDNGSEDCGSFDPTNALAVDDPASQPFVTGVGGTSVSALGPPPQESVWNNRLGAGGGGISSLWQMPSYQSAAPPSLNVINSSSSGGPCSAKPPGYCREVPDVSADANPFTGYAMFWNGSWLAAGGTSGAAPTWAAFTALANASSNCNGTAIGFANPVLYAVAAKAYSSDFNDVTSGDNDSTQTNGGKFAAGTGYDMASGLGTPVGSALAADLCSARASENTITVTGPGNQVETLGTGPVTPPLQIKAQDSDSAKTPTLTYSAIGLPPGLKITGSGSNGFISGTPTTPGIYNVTVGAYDSTYAAGSISFVWTINRRSTNTSVACSPATVSAGLPTTCTATVSDSDSGSPTTPTGSVSFASSGPGSFSGTSSCTLSGGSCQVTYIPSARGSGTHTITANYNGDASHLTSTRSTGETVTAEATTTSVSCFPAFLGPGRQTTCTATASDSDPADPLPPGGSVTFSSSSPGSFSGACTLVGGSCQVIFMPSTPGSQQVGASYGGDAAHAASSGGFGLLVAMPPAAHINAPANDQTYTLYQRARTSFSCMEGPGGPGIIFCRDSGGATGGSGTLDTSTVGTHSYSVTAISQDGDTATTTITYTVIGIPHNVARPSIAGRAQAGATLSCSAGAWSEQPAHFTYQWSRNGTPIVGASSSTYRVRAIDEGNELSCTVIASNAAGSWAVSSNALGVPVPFVARCPRATGRIAGARLSRVKLGDTLRQAERAYAHSSRRRSRSGYSFCLTPIGVRVGFAPPRLLSRLRAAQRRAVSGRVIWISTRSAYYALDGIRPGATVAAARAVLRLGRPLHVGGGDWYFTPAGPANGMLEVRGGIVQEIGLADKRLTTGRSAQRALLNWVS